MYASYKNNIIKAALIFYVQIHTNNKDRNKQLISVITAVLSTRTSNRMDHTLTTDSTIQDINRIGIY